MLVVDGHADAAESLALVLSYVGHRAVVARSGRSALAAAEREPPDVVLLELRLRDADGWEVARRLRAAGCQARLIAVTTCGRPADRQRSHAVGIERHLVKPVEPAELLAALVEAERSMVRAALGCPAAS